VGRSWTFLETIMEFAAFGVAAAVLSLLVWPAAVQLHPGRRLGDMVTLQPADHSGDLND
jgi:hypothetical protein